MESFSPFPSYWLLSCISNIETLYNPKYCFTRKSSFLWNPLTISKLLTAFMQLVILKYCIVQRERERESIPVRQPSLLERSPRLYLSLKTPAAQDSSVCCCLKRFLSFQEDVFSFQYFLVYAAYAG